MRRIALDLVGALLICPLRVSLFYIGLDRVRKTGSLLSTPPPIVTVTSLSGQFMNNFLWWGYSSISLLLVLPFLPDGNYSTHLLLGLLALICVPAALVDCASLFNGTSFATSFTSSLALLRRDPVGLCIAYFIFWEVFRYVPERVAERLLTASR